MIHNGRLLPVASPTQRSVRSIASRVLDAAARSALIGDLFRIYSATLQEQASFQWVTIPENVDLAGNEVFDPVLMKRLHAAGYEIALKGPVWETKPPGLQTGPPP